MYRDKDLTCRDCKQDFVFSASEQEFYQEKGFQNEPVRCPDCRQKNKQQRDNRSGRGSDRRGNRGNREMFEATCAKCGKVAKVPFKPTSNKPVYCRDCFNSSR